jgi:hypothetical protein
MEEARYGVIPVVLMAMMALGGIAAAFAVQVSQLQLMAVVVSAVLIEVLVIALAPMRFIFWASVAAFIIDLFVFIF